MESDRTVISLDEFRLLSDGRPALVVEAGQSLLSRPDGELTESERAYIRFRVGIARIARGDFESAIHILTEARQRHEELGEEDRVLRDLQAIGIVYGLQEQHEAAFETFLNVRNAAQEMGFPETVEAAYCNLGRICCELERYDEGRGFLNAALKLIETTGNEVHRAAVFHELGRIELGEGRLESAEALLEEAWSFTEKRGDYFGYEYPVSLAELYTRQSRFGPAEDLLKTALDMSRRNGTPLGETLALFHLGNLADRRGDTLQAAEYWTAGFEMAVSRGMRSIRILCARRLAEQLRDQGDFRGALNYLENLRDAENEIRAERLHHTISVYDQSMRIDDLEQEMQAWRRRSGELERIRSDREESIRELETIKNIGEELTASLDSARIIQVLHDRLSQILTVDGLVIGYYLENENILDVRHVVEHGRVLESTRMEIDPDQSLASWVIRNDRDLLIHSRDECTPYTRSIRHIETSSLFSESFLIVRLKIEGRIIGILSVQAAARNAYRERHLRVLQALAGFIAIALVNSNAHQSLLQAKERIAYMATHDPLTGLPNRMRIIERLDEELNRCRRYRTSLAVLFIDLDGFKIINDTRGHGAGDAALKEVATRLTSGIRTTDAVGRLAGDEFLVILTDNCSEENGRHLAEQIRLVISRPIDFKEHELQVTGSVGIAFYPADGQGSEELVNAADQAMYEAKAGGKNRSSRYAAGRTGI